MRKIAFRQKSEKANVRRRGAPPKMPLLFPKKSLLRKSFLGAPLAELLLRPRAYRNSNGRSIFSKNPVKQIVLFFLSVLTFPQIGVQ